MRDEPDNGNKHQIPVIDRMMEILDLLAMRSAGATISDLVETIVVPRTTIYRILNTLQAHGMVRRSPAGSYTLGPRLLALASRVSGDRPGYDLVALALPHLEQLSDVIGEASKVTVLDGDEALVLAAVNGNREYALTVTPGQKLPLHAGAASKILLASIPDADRTRILHASLARYTPKTIVDPRRLANELARVRRQGWAQDKGEFSPSVQAFAAPIIEVDSGVVGALSIPFLTGASPERQDEIKAAVLAAADAISAALPAGGKASRRGDATPARSSLAAPKLRRRAAGLR